MHHPAEPVAKGQRLGALKIDLAIEPHQQLHGHNAIVARAERPTLVRPFIRKVLNCVAQNLQRSSSLGRNVPASFRLRLRNQSGWCGCRSEVAG